MDSSIVVSIISASSAIFVAVLTTSAMIISAKITSKQKENESTIKALNERLLAANMIIKNLEKRENQYLDMLKEWTGDSKKHILANIDNTSRQQ